MHVWVLTLTQIQQCIGALCQHVNSTHERARTLTFTQVVRRGDRSGGCPGERGIMQDSRGCQGGHWSTAWTEDGWDAFSSCVKTGKDRLGGVDYCKKKHFVMSILVGFVFLRWSLSLSFCLCLFLCVSKSGSTSQCPSNLLFCPHRITTPLAFLSGLVPLSHSHFPSLITGCCCFHTSSVTEKEFTNC